jgi:hypothetical protein
MKTLKFSMVLLFSIVFILGSSAQKLTNAENVKEISKKRVKTQVGKSINTPTVISLDFNERKFENITKLEEISRGDFYQLNIKNINLNLYSVQLENKDSVIQSAVSFPTFDLISLDNLSEYLNGLSPLITSAQKNKYIPPNMPSPPISRSDENIIYIERMNWELVRLTQVKNNLNRVLMSIDSLQLSLNKCSLSYLVENRKSNYLNYLNSKFFLENALQATEFIRSKIKDISNYLNESSMKYETFMADEKLYTVTDTVIIKRDKELKQAFSITIESIIKVYSSIDAAKIFAWFSSLTIMENNNTWEYNSLPLQKTGDRTSLIIKVVPKSTDYRLSSYQTEIQFPTYTRSYIGIGMAYYVSSLYNDSFSFTTSMVDTVASYTIVDETPKKSEIGIATLLYFGGRLKDRDLGGHITIGPAFSISNKIKPRLTTGLGLSFGKKQMLSFDLLFMVGYVDRLSNAYPIDGVFSASPSNITVSKLQYGGAFSLGYIYKF